MTTRPPIAPMDPAQPARPPEAPPGAFPAEGPARGAPEYAPPPPDRCVPDTAPIEEPSPEVSLTAIEPTL